MLTILATYWWVIAVVLILVSYKLMLRLFGMVIIPQETIGIVYKKFVLVGSNRSLPDGQIVALHGEPGWQADTLGPGLKFGFWPWQYTIKQEKFLTVPPGRMAIVTARDGKPISNGRVLGRSVDCDSFQDTRKFLEAGGERGPQGAVIMPGTWRLNTQQFTCEMASAVEVKDDTVGVVTTMDGKPLDTQSGQIAGPSVQNHNMYQTYQQFVDGGGCKGLQEEVILAGRYYINPKFATVEAQPMTEVEIAHAGVVIAYVGEKGQDTTGDTFKHGNLVARGHRGVWDEPLDPGRYPINPYTHRVEPVPTANVVLNWATGKTEAHKLDANLSTITVRSSDGFKFNLDVSQIIHIPRNDAPRVIARFGNMENLVTQVLEPTIGNYFRNAAQNADVIDFLKSRSQRQEQARDAISKALSEYNVGAVDTLIGDIVPPEDLMKTLTDRKLAEQQQVTFVVQKTAQETRRDLQQAQAMADTQPSVVASERKVQIADFEAQAKVKTAEGDARANIAKADGEAQAKVKTADGDAQAKTINAKADAEVLTVNANAQASKTKALGEADAHVIEITGAAQATQTLAVGEAEAAVIQKKTDAVGPDNFARIEVARELATHGIKLVPDIQAGGGTDGASQTMAAVLLGGAMLEKLNGHAGNIGKS